MCENLRSQQVHKGTEQPEQEVGVGHRTGRGGGVGKGEIPPGASAGLEPGRM